MSLAFIESLEYGGDEIFLMRADGSDLQQLTNSDFDYGRIRDLSVSPDGTQIAYEDDFEIHVISVDGNVQWRIPNTDRLSAYPSWAPDGEQIVFSSVWERGEDGYWLTFEIFVMDILGIDRQQLTWNDEEEVGPEWSPDGRYIAFVGKSERLDDDTEILIMNADGTGIRQLTNDLDEYYDLSWSPDSERIAFRSNRDGDFEIFSMNADGTGVTQLTFNDYWDGRPVWSPDGRYIAYHSESDGVGGIAVMDADGGNISLTGQQGTYPVWIP